MSERPAGRYGAARRKTPRWMMFAIGAVVIIAGLVVSYVGYKQYGPKDIEPDRLGYTVVDDATVEVDFKVTRKDPGKPVVCIVRAMTADSAEVGRREVLIPASDSGTVRLTTTIKTTARAGAGNVYACTDDVPAYLRAG
ncbi:DUF4307 domain-containing protein [Nocardia sp. NBC_01503]|uniref:DUF4307 domain-containing protein n=1 Tax=Nocardia sp. NBC_01503 TaxID=2975997 RepID=UPI002E7C2611|nr:DUF4307 domain-containing protein [Nocardia sp. NBC_01503]WTL35706.1 DUF4307 domain-containing protein [Nocardia sp. NBC_01503]